MKNLNVAERDAVNVSIITCGSGGSTPRYVNFQHKPCLKVGHAYTVTDGRTTISGKVVEADWQGNHKLDTKGGVR